MFPLFKSHLDLAHQYWQRLVKRGDTVIDATCGNGHDTLFLAQLCLNENEGGLYAIDISPKAIALTKKNLEQHLSKSILERVILIEGCHSSFPTSLNPTSVKLITYNLGYLPGGGDKTQTTKVGTTLESLRQALQLLEPGGALSITCYPGHAEGEIEENHVIKFAASLDSAVWNCVHHVRLNRNKAPSLLLIQKST